MTVSIGVDTGGTFTDVCVIDDAGRLTIHKLPSTPADPSIAILDGARQGLENARIEPGSVGYFGHGTTVATNTILEGRGARTGVITTEGFRDLLDIGRQERPDLYDLQVEKPPVLVRRRDRLEVPERLLYDGTVEKALDERAVAEAIELLKERGVEAIAVCFLYSYLYPQHEQRVLEMIREMAPEIYPSTSHQVLAEFREYERLSTTVINAYVGPVMAGYISRLRDRVRDLGVLTEPFITQSNGGLISLDEARQLPVRTVLSGPAAGVAGAGRVAEAAGLDNVITFDMGGTSTDVSLISEGAVQIGIDSKVAGYPIRAPMIDINTVGAGGGSIAWIDSGGHLKVGPRSAGAEPGPAGYGRGGTEATVTDANLALGILNREHLLGGRMPVDAGAADRAVERLASELGLESMAVAEGILSIVNVNMGRAIRVISIERGYDPRDFTLIAFGGAGPLHATRLARELEIPRVLVPTVPGALCALGLLLSDLRADFSRTLTRPALPEALDDIQQGFREIEAEASAWLDREGVEEADRRLRRIADMRYIGQNYELAIDVPDGDLTPSTLERILDAFHAEHDRSYGFSAPGEPAQIVTVRVEARGLIPTPEFPEIERGSGVPEPATSRAIHLAPAGGRIKVPVYQRESLLAGQRFDGPAVIEQMDSTTFVLDGQSVTVDRYGNLMIQEERS
ncbi:MAG: hydantoinase/oxoprolinase family protein [Thermomicrobiales bacterium]